MESMVKETANKKELTMGEAAKTEGSLYPEKVGQDIHAMTEALKGMNMKQLIGFCADLGESYDPELVNEGWLRRKAERLGRSNVLKEAGIAEMKLLAEQRAESYRRAADLTVDTANQSPESIAREILRRIRVSPHDTGNGGE